MVLYSIGQSLPHSAPKRAPGWALLSAVPDPSLAIRRPRAAVVVRVASRVALRIDTAGRSAAHVGGSRPSASVSAQCRARACPGRPPTTVVTDLVSPLRVQIASMRTSARASSGSTVMVASNGPPTRRKSDCDGRDEDSMIDPGGLITVRQPHHRRPVSPFGDSSAAAMRGFTDRRGMGPRAWALAIRCRPAHRGVRQPRGDRSALSSSQLRRLRGGRRYRRRALTASAGFV